MSDELLELRCIELTGSPRGMGESHGEQLREEIQKFVDQRMAALAEYLAERGLNTSAGFVELAAACRAVAAEWDPDGGAEHLGIARGARVDPDLLYGAANMTDVRDALLLPSAADREGCSALLLGPESTRDGVVLAGQTWDLNPSDLEFVVAVHRRPARGPATWSITCTGCLCLMGMNERGLSAGTTNIKVRGAHAGAGYLSILTRALACGSQRAAQQVIASAPRAAAHTYWLADAAGAVELECDADGCSQRSLSEGPIARTNHCLSAARRERESEQPNSSSVRRLERLEEQARLGGQDLDSIKQLFADRSRGVESISRFPEDAQGTATNAVMLCVPGKREIWACRGPVQRGRWQRLHFDV